MSPQNVIDAHRHVWDTISSGGRNHTGLGAEQLTYSWLEDLPLLQGSFMPQDIEFVASADFNLLGSVFVEAGCDQSGRHEASWVNQLNWGANPLLGVVAKADLTLGAEIETYLTTLLSEAPNVVGIRHILQGQPRELFQSAQLKAGLESVRDRGLTVDMCISHDQLPWLIDLVDQHPTLNFVLDHLGKPPVAQYFAEGTDPIGSEWFKNLVLLAEHPGAHVKLSGLACEADPKTVHEGFADIARPYLESGAEIFGANRSMFGSDWPVSMHGVDPSLSFESWLHIVFNQALNEFTQEQRDQIAHLTAQCFYGVKLPKAVEVDD